MTSDPGIGMEPGMTGTDGMVDLAPRLMDAEPSPAQPKPGRGKAGRHGRRDRPDKVQTGAERSEPWGPVAQEHDPIHRASEREPAVLCALLMLRDALVREEGFPEVAGRSGTVSVIQVPDRAWGRCIADAWDLIVQALEVAPEGTVGGRSAEPLRQRSARTGAAFRQKLDTDKGTDQFQIYERRGKAVDGVDFLRDAVARGKAVHLFTTDPDGLLAPDILVAEAQRLHIPPLSLDMLVTLALHNQARDKRARGGLREACQILGDTAAEVTPLLLNVAYRTSGTPTEFLRQLEAMLAKQKALSPEAPTDPILTLDSLPGLGAAGAWGRGMADDLRAYAAGRLAWSEMDRGIVLEGPPGSGKSTFARALAGSAGVPLVASSLAQWQGHREGHLGTLLSAMQATFAEARRVAPCVLLIDEIDSFPSRASVTHRYRDYVVEVVNGLLEQLDGVADRTGVLVIATCNDAGGLDSALTRPGRLERIVPVGRPDAEGIELILRVHLGDALRSENLMPLAGTAVVRRAVGADIEAWCRGARRRARVEGRPMIMADLVEEIGPPPPVHSPAAVRRMAVHEAGHAVAFGLMAAGVLKEVVIDPRVGGRSRTTVDTLEVMQDVPHPTHRQAVEHLKAILSGRAAEEVLLEDPSGGAGGSHGSDLAKATRLACTVVASSGLDQHPDRLLFLGAADDPSRLDHIMLLPDIRERVAAILGQAYDEALAMVRQRMAVVRHIADILVRDGHLSGEAVEAMLKRNPVDTGLDGDSL